MGYHQTPHGMLYVIRRLPNSNNVATSTALEEVCARLSVILVCGVISCFVKRTRKMWICWLWIRPVSGRRRYTWHCGSAILPSSSCCWKLPVVTSSNVAPSTDIGYVSLCPRYRIADTFGFLYNLISVAVLDTLDGVLILLKSSDIFAWLLWMNSGHWRRTSDAKQGDVPFLQGS